MARALCESAKRNDDALQNRGTYVVGSKSLLIQQADERAVRSLSRLLFSIAVACAIVSGCGPVYTPSQSFTLARNLEARPLDIESNLRGMLVRFEFDDAIVEGTIAEVDPEAVRIGETWYPLERMRDPGDNYIRNTLTGVGVLTRFIDAETGELIDQFIDANRIRRIRIGEQWYELSRIRFLDSPRFDDPDRWVDQRVRATTRNRGTYEGLIVPIDVDTFSVDGEVLAVSDLRSFEIVTRCFECEGGRGFLIMAMIPFIIIGLGIAGGVYLTRRLMRKKAE